MATVHLACTDAIAGRDRFVALKVVHPHLTKDPGFLEMFADEMRIASLIHHPNVCRVLDGGHQGAEHFLAMEYLMGENLASIFRRRVKQAGELDLVEHARLVARVMADACAGLHAAHELRDADGEPLEVVHRDVSPENIFLTHDGVAKIVDFGVAQAARQHHRTTSGFVKGKLPYLQPEAIAGDPLDRRADVWGIGVTTWELLTGLRLFRREGDIETIRAIDEDEIPPPSEVCEGLPKVLDAIVLRALARRPGDRFESAREMGRALLGAFAAEARVADLADLAEWMERLFPGGRERDEQLLAMAERFADQSVRDPSEPIDDEPTHRRSYLPPPRPPLGPVSFPYVPMRAPRRHRRALRTALALLVGATLGALATKVSMDDFERTSPQQTKPPALAESTRYRPSADVLPTTRKEEFVPIGLARLWDEPGASPPDSGRCAFELDEASGEALLRFRPTPTPAPEAPEP
jgi:serine/threonine-protein kinase